MNVVSINPKDKEIEKNKADMLEVLDYMKKMIEDGHITEFVACSLDEDGMAQIHAKTKDLPGGVGLFEIGKHLLISQF
jgi:hypothetical protein